MASRSFSERGNVVLDVFICICYHINSTLTTEECLRVPGSIARLGKSTRVFDHCTSLFLFAVDDNHVNDEQSDGELPQGLRNVRTMEEGSSGLWLQWHT